MASDAGHQRTPMCADSGSSVGVSAPTLSSCGEVMSVGSAFHPIDCTPCAFYCFKRQGCVKDKACTYCHMAHKSRQIKRREAWRRLQVERRQLKHALAQDGLRGQHLVRAAACSEELTRAPAAHTLPRPTALLVPSAHMLPVPAALFVVERDVGVTAHSPASAMASNESAALAAPAAPWRREHHSPTWDFAQSACESDDIADGHLGPSPFSTGYQKSMGHQKGPYVVATSPAPAEEDEVEDPTEVVTILHF